MLRARRGLHSGHGVSQAANDARISGAYTSEAIDSPLLELLEGDVCRGRRRVEVESVGVLLLFVTAVEELLLAVVDVPPFCVYPVEVLSEHGDCRVEGKKERKNSVHDQLILVKFNAVWRGVGRVWGPSWFGRRAWTRCAPRFPLRQGQLSQSGIS